MNRYSVVPTIEGAEVFDERSGRPIDRYPTITAAERAAQRLNVIGQPRLPRFAEL